MDTPVVASTTTNEDVQSSLIVIHRNANDGAEVSHFRISNISAGSLYHADGTTPIANGSYVTYTEAQAGLRFTPAPDSHATGSFDVEASQNGTSVAAQSGIATATITVRAIGDSPLIGNITTDEDAQSGLITIDRNANDARRGEPFSHFGDCAGQLVPGGWHDSDQ